MTEGGVSPSVAGCLCEGTGVEPVSSKLFTSFRLNWLFVFSITVAIVLLH